MKTLRIIKHYNNRKFYDLHTHCYVNHSYIGNLIIKGIDVMVVRHETNEDITKSVVFDALSPTLRTKVSIDKLIELIK